MKGKNKGPGAPIVGELGGQLCWTVGKRFSEEVAFKLKPNR